MKIMKPLVAVLLACCLTSQLSAHETAQEAANKKTAIAFYDAFNKQDFDTIRGYLGDTYTQHNPGVKNGPEGLKEALTGMKNVMPDLKIEIKRAFADGDYVILHCFGATKKPGDRGSAVIDIFRFEKGKIVEHWDVIQQVPEKAANNNTMF